MLKERITNSLTAPYDYYLADLFCEIEKAGVPTIIPPGKRLVRAAGSKAEDAEAISLTLPPVPPVFERLPLDALTNIRWGVQIYFDFLKPLGEKELRKRTNALYVSAQESTKNWGEDEKDPRNVERNLLARTIANKRESLDKDAHLHFYVLMLMQIGLLLRKLLDSKSNTITICHQIELSFAEARNRHRTYREKESAARKRARALERVLN